MATSQLEPDPEAIIDHHMQYGHGPSTEAELDEKYPDRPRNIHKTLPFHDLYIWLFNPLNENKKQPTGSKIARAKKGPHGPSNLSPHEMRRKIIERFISRWRNEVGNDFYPALRLILPEKDRDRPMYGLKEKAIGKLIVKVLKINPGSEDGQNLLNWKLPGQNAHSRMAGDFAGRCYEVLSKREMRQQAGNMRIAEVNQLLDKLAVASKENEQLPIFETFYNQMNADEMMWLIRIILRQMNIGASEKTILELWHPDGEQLFNVSSSLRRVCWDLSDPTIKLEEEKSGIALMNCFQPQLAQFQMHSFDKMIAKLGVTEDDEEFWIEEKLDGERMQLHMQEDPSTGEQEFAFWSRKGKDYTYLYGSSFDDDNSSLTRHIKSAFRPSVRNLILDGEMITWDPEEDVMVGFGTLKSAAILGQQNPYDTTSNRPLFRVFDCLFLNDENLTPYTLRDRMAALEKSITNVHRRIEIHPHEVATTVKQVDDALRKVVAESAEGLVLKNPRSRYQLNSRNDDWMKVKPEYMDEFGESLDCVVIGGYYGSGHRGGEISSFLCGLRLGENDTNHRRTNFMKCVSFFKVGGGFRAPDYALIREITKGKWTKWDRAHPPTDFIVLGGGDKQYERPDVWIRPCDSIVVEAKAASVAASDQFGTGFTLRFPRFKKLRDDKNWNDALSVDEFLELKARVDAESKEKVFKVSEKRKVAKRLKKEIVIAGSDVRVRQYGGPKSQVFQGLDFCVLSEMIHPQKKSKTEVEQIIKSNGGSIFQSPTVKEDIICIGEKKVVKVASLIKSGHTNIIKPCWILDVIKQAEIDERGRTRYLVPWEPGHVFHITDEARETMEGTVDTYGDSYARDITIQELDRIMKDMVLPKNHSFTPANFLSELEERGKGLDETPGSMYRRIVLYFVSEKQQNEVSRVDLTIAKNQFMFAGGRIAENLDDEDITHFVLVDDSPKLRQSLRAHNAKLKRRLPKIVGLKWLQDSWHEKTLLDEERYVVAL